METLLVADIGGTKTELAIFPAGETRKPLVSNRYVNANFSGPEPVIDEFLSNCGIKPQYGCMAVAAVIKDSTASLTNLNWQLSASRLESRYRLKKVLLINDLTAIACSTMVLQEDTELQIIQPGVAPRGAICGILAPGTGLGQGLLVRCETGYVVQGSEGGHCDFAPVTGEQRHLLTWRQLTEQQVSYEDLISGSGIPTLHRFCTDQLKTAQKESVMAELERVSDKTPVIVAGALMDDPCPSCVKTVDLFLAILGSEAGNLALKLYATGGIFLGGGILPRLAPHVSFNGFLNAFRAKGKMRELMNDFPIHLILRTDAPLLGAAKFYGDILEEDSE